MVRKGARTNENFGKEKRYSILVYPFPFLLVFFSYTVSPEAENKTFIWVKRLPFSRDFICVPYLVSRSDAKYFACIK